MTMDKRIKDIYTLMLIKNARVVHFFEYNSHYEVHLEWLVDPFGARYTNSYFDDEPQKLWIEKKLIAFAKIRRQHV